MRNLGQLLCCVEGAENLSKKRRLSAREVKTRQGQKTAVKAAFLTIMSKSRGDPAASRTNISRASARRSGEGFRGQAFFVLL